MRELEHLIQRAVLLCKDDVIRVEDLPFLLVGQPAGDAAERKPFSPLTQPAEGEEEKQQLLAALQAANWIIYGDRGAARLLGMNPERLRSRMRKYGLRKPKKPGAGA